MPDRTALVIGAGALGLTTAWELTKGGFSVTVVSSPDLEREVGWGSVGWANASSKVRLGYPDHYAWLNIEGLAAMPDLAAELEGQMWWHPSGAVEVVSGTEAAERLASDVARLVEDFGYAAALLDAQDFATSAPGFELRAGELAASFPREGWVDAQVLLSSLTHRIAERGGTFLRADVVHVERTGDRIVEVTMSNGATVRSDVVVLCAGASTSEVAALAGLHVPTAPSDDDRVPGLAVDITLAEGELETVIVFPEVTIRPFGRHRALLAGDGHGVPLTWGSSSRQERFSAAEVLLERAQARSARLHRSSILDVRLSARTIPPDGMTIAGIPHGVSNAYVVATHSGLTLAPLIAVLAAREISTGTPSDRLDPYRPERFTTSLVPADPPHRQWKA
jgi:glycine/D-amino acid oxidase-like deaminating enzyme